MNDVLSNSLYKQDKSCFDRLKTRVKEFSAGYIGSNIIQDDIFGIMTNYAQRNSIPLRVLRYPILDEDVCAFTTQVDEMFFVIINSALPISKQIFAAAHELFHLFRYVDDKQDAACGESLLTAKEMDEETTEKEDVEANAFAGLLLVTSSALVEQIEVYGIDRNQIKLSDVVRLMDVFAVPYKAVVLRLYEESYVNEKVAHSINAALFWRRNAGVKWRRAGIIWQRSRKEASKQPRYFVKGAEVV